jgi:hypothetical protein
MRLVIHASEKNAEIVIDGRGYVIPPNVPYEVLEISGTDHMTGDYPYQTSAKDVAAEMVRTLWHVGLVEIPIETVKTRNGITYQYDEAAALQKSRELIVKAEENMLMAYVTQCRELMGENKPAQPPGPRIAEIIKKHGINLKEKYNISPVGFDVVAASAAKNAEMDQLRQAMAEQQKMIDQLLAMQKKPKQPVETPAI